MGGRDSEASVELRPGEVHVWRVDLEGSGKGECFLEVLDEEERGRAARFRFEKDRKRYASRHAVLRRILARYTGVEPGEVRFLEGRRGKPEVEGQGGGGVRFNMSHSGGVALVAVAIRTLIKQPPMAMPRAAPEAGGCSVSVTTMRNIDSPTATEYMMAGCTAG